MVDTFSSPNPAPTDRPLDGPLHAAAPKTEKPGSNSLERGFFNAAKQIGHNIDLVTFQGRVKDLYKAADSVGVGISLLLKNVFWRRPGEIGTNPAEQFEELAKLFESSTSHEDLKKGAPGPLKTIAEKFKELRDKNVRAESARLFGNRVGDALNFLAQWAIAKTSNNVEQDKLTRVYAEALKQELGVTTLTKEDYKRSANPIISNSVEYYARKGKYRMLPVWLGLVHAIPAIASLFGQKAEKATNWMNDFSGSDLSLGGMAGYYAWYFSKRQKGAFYELDDIWDQTEGITTAENRTINRGVNPGTLVTSEKITKLYDEVSKEQNIPAFEVTDPLTNRIFDQIARYLNHQYQPLLYRVKKPDPKLHEELKGSHFTHADLITLLGTQGIDINDAYATALRMETLARTNIEQYRKVNEAIAANPHPVKSAFASEADFANGLGAYIAKLDAIGEATLGTAWPASYIKNEIRPNIASAYNLTPPPLEPETTISPPDHATHSKLNARDVALDALSHATQETPGTRGDAMLREKADFRTLVGARPGREAPAETHTLRLDQEPQDAKILAL